MDSTRLGFQEYIVIGVLFSSLLFLTFYLSQQAHAAFVDSHNPNLQIYYNDNNRMTVVVPSSWTITEQDIGVYMVRNTAVIGVERIYSGATNTPMEEIVNTFINDVSNANPTFELISSAPITLSTTYSDMPAYQLYYVDQQNGESVTNEAFIIPTGDDVYAIKYQIPESLYQESLPDRDYIIHQTAVGDFYDTVAAPALKQLDRTNQANGQVAILNEQARSNNALANSVADSNLEVLREQNAAADKEYDKYNDGVNDDYNDDVINEEGEVIDYNK